MLECYLSCAVCWSGLERNVLTEASLRLCMSRLEWSVLQKIIENLFFICIGRGLE